MTTSSNKLFVGGLSWGTTDAVLGEEFSKYGTINEAIVVRDKLSGKSRGFGFVRFQEDDDALKAKDATDGQVLDGRMVRVDFASEKRRVPGMQGMGAPGMQPYDPASMYTTLLPQQQQQQQGLPGQYGANRGFMGNNQNYAMMSGFAPYGMQPNMGMYGAGMPGDPNSSLTQSFSQSTAATFQLIENIVGAFGGFAQMLQSTYMATHSSFFGMSLTWSFFSASF